MDILYLLSVLAIVIPVVIALYHIYTKLLMHIENDKNVEKLLQEVLKKLPNKRGK